MKRRHFLHHGTQAALASALLPLAAKALPVALPAEKPETATAQEPQDKDLDLSERTIADLQAYMQSAGSSYRLCQLYLARIKALDGQGPTLRAVIELNPEALTIAEALDKERKAGKVSGPLHGIPVLIKDNIDTSDQPQTTAGALALAGHRASHDAFVVQRLRAAGAVILGKTNLSEWANFRSTSSVSGTSSRMA